MSPTEAPHPPGGRPRVSHESRDVRPKVIFWFAVWLTAAALAIHVGIWGVFKLLEARERREQRPVSPLVASSLRRTPAEPRLEPLPLLPRQRLKAEEEKALTSYGWVDRSAGVVRIPIARAMEIVARKGVPGGKPMPPAPANPPAPAGGAR